MQSTSMVSSVSWEGRSATGHTVLPAAALEDLLASVNYVILCRQGNEQHLFRRGGGISATGPTVFPAGALKDLLLVGVLADKAVYGHLLALPDPVTPSHGLKVILQAHSINCHCRAVRSCMMHVTGLHDCAWGVHLTCKHVLQHPLSQH